MPSKPRGRAHPALFAWVLALLCGAASAQTYGLARSHRLGGEGGWDYLSHDAASNRLFITRGNRVQVVDADTGTVVGQLADTPGVHGVAIAAELGKGYTSNGRDNSVGVFDLKTLRPLARVATPLGLNPDFIVYDAVTRRVFAFNGRSHNASVIDASTDRLVATIPLRGKPEAAVADGRGGVFVDIEDTNELTAINAADATVTATWPLKGCDEPAGLAMDLQARRLFVGCHNRTLLVVDADSGALVGKLAIGAGVDANAYDPQTRQVFSSQGDGTLSIIAAPGGDRYAPAQTVATRAGARTMALNTATHEVYLVTADFDEQPPAPGTTRPQRVMRPDSFTLLVLRPAGP
jgi:DNA-binding beta-propeller fold protein YncE